MGSWVGPAVIKILLLLIVPASNKEANNSMISDGSSILPKPTSPQACSPDPGPYNEKFLCSRF